MQNDVSVFLTESLLDVDENSDYFFEISVNDVIMKMENCLYLYQIIQIGYQSMDLI